MSRCVMCIPCYAPVMFAGLVGTLLLGTALAGAAEPPGTCIFVPTLPHRMAGSAAREDVSAPGTPVVVAVDAFRRSGMTCTRASCVANSCGDTGTVRIDLAPSADDATPTEELGYRLEVVRGDVPESMRPLIGVPLAAGQMLYLRPGFDELPALDLELTAVALDAAGNESEPTAPFGIQFDGCTLAAVGDRCEDELDPDTDLSSVLGGVGNGPGAAPDASGGVSCALPSTRSPAARAGAAAVVALLFGAWARRAARARLRGR